MASALQAVIAIGIIILILLQERSSGLSGIFGGGLEGGVYHTRRGLEKIIFWSTVALIALFIVIAIAQLVG